MTIVLGAVAVVALAVLGRCCWRLRSRHRVAWALVGGLSNDLTEVRRGAYELRAARDDALEALADLDQRLLRISTERDLATRRGEQASQLLLNRLATERSTYAQRITDERLEYAARLRLLTLVLLGLLARAALPPAAPATPVAPAALPSGDFLTVDGDGPVILQLDDWHQLEPLPAGTNGTGSR